MQLTQEGTSQDPAVRSAAVAELADLVTLFPNSIPLRQAYAMVLAIGGAHQEALAQAEALSSLDDGSHVIAHTLGQVYLLCGDLVAARDHARRALEAADSEEDREDALELLRRISDAEC